MARLKENHSLARSMQSSPGRKSKAINAPVVSTATSPASATMNKIVRTRRPSLKSLYRVLKRRLDKSQIAPADITTAQFRRTSDSHIRSWARASQTRDWGCQRQKLAAILTITRIQKHRFRRAVFAMVPVRVKETKRTGISLTDRWAGTMRASVAPQPVWLYKKRSHS